MKKFSNVTIAPVYDPRAMARFLVTFVAALLVVLLALMGLASGPGGQRAFAQEEPPPEPTGPQLQLLNPSNHPDPSDVPTDNPPDVSDKNDGVDELYHLVAWTANEPSGAIIEAYYTPTTIGGVPLQEITIGLLERVPGSGDTWEFFWDIPESVPEGPGTITVRLFEDTLAGSEVVAEDSTNIEMRARDGGTPPNGDAQPAGDTVEMTWPTQNGPIGFFRPRGGEWRTIVDGSVSEITHDPNDQTNPFLVQIQYTTSDPGAEPEWKVCAEVGGVFGFFAGGEFRVMCTLNGDDLPTHITAFSATVFEDQNPEAITTAYTQEASDAHRVQPYLQVPDQMSITLEPLSTNDTGGTYRQVVGSTSTGDPHACIAFVAEVRDHLDREVQGANIDVHAQGPDDQLQFGDEDRRNVSSVTFEGANSSNYKVPDKAGHSTEAAENCDRDAENAGEGHKEKPVEGQQGDHNIPGGADIKHRENVNGSGLDGGSSTGFGRWNFHLFSPNVGSTQVTAWVDDAGLTSESAERPADPDTLDPNDPTATATLQWLPGQITLQFDPPGDTAQVGTCNKYTVKVRGGNVPVRGINVDIHATGPTNELDFCDPGDGTPRRAPDTTGTDEDHEAEDAGESHHRGEPPTAQHTEGETDDAGNFVIGITSPVSGDTTLEGWVDGEKGADNDTRASSEASGRATKSWAASLADAQVSFVNPSPYGGNGTRVSNKTDVDNRYHIQTRVDAFGVPGVELFISSDSGATFQKLGDAQQVSGSDTWEFYWDVNVPDRSYVLRAQVTGTDRREDITITVNKEDGTGDNPADFAYETLEITSPFTTQSTAFTNRETTVEGVVSEGTEGVDLFYTKVAAKDTPTSADWIFCGFTEPKEDRSFNGACKLQGSDQASSVTGIAAITFDCAEEGCDPAPGGDLPREPGERESGDAHRVFGFEGRPSVSIEPAETGAKPGSCQRMTLTVNDETGQALADQNVDVHLAGPVDDVHFCDPDTGSSARRAPDQGNHGAETGETDEGIHADSAPSTKHTEGETNSSGQFIFGVISPAKGDSQVTGWADQSDNDVQDDEPSDASVVHWGQSTGGGGGNELQSGPCKGYAPNSRQQKSDGSGLVIVGTSGPDDLRGGSGNDLICGLGGRDAIRGQGGADRLFGGGGHDDIRGNAGNDFIAGAAGLDVIRGGGGADVAKGGGQDDTIRGYIGRDRLVGGPGNDTLRGGRHNDRLVGNKGDDLLGGGAGFDTCRPGPGNDTRTSCEN